MRWLGLPVSVLFATACGGGSSTPDGGQVFVAFAASFAGFHDWEPFDVTATAQPGTVHPEERLIEYLNRRPPPGSTEFPVGTIIVKESTEGELAARKSFAMVKRGGGYNPVGAPNWEWFELQNLAGGGVDIVWRGVGPPIGEVYGGDPNAGCNSCHRDCGNDAVCAPAVRLGGL